LAASSVRNNPLHHGGAQSLLGSTINVKYTVDEWSRRIKALLSWHFVQLVDVPGLWVIQVPNEGPVHGVMAMADGPFVVER